MNKKILWIEDDYYAIQGLFHPMEKEGFKLDVAVSALDGYRKAQKWKEYDLIVVDLILPVSQQQETAPELVKSWEDEKINKHVGIGVVKWLVETLKVECPVIIMSVVPDPIAAFNLENLKISGYISKSGLLPTNLNEQLTGFLKKN
jgi:CheY-like chemotaxis protein